MDVRHHVHLLTLVFVHMIAAQMVSLRVDVFSLSCLTISYGCGCVAWRSWLLLLKNIHLEVLSLPLVSSIVWLWLCCSGVMAALVHVDVASLSFPTTSRYVWLCCVILVVALVEEHPRGQVFSVSPV